MNENPTPAHGKRRSDIAAMFDRIAPAYDRLNRILSFGTDIIWRKRAVKLGGVANDSTWLDLAAGSGDMAASGRKLAPGSRWVAADPSIELLRILTRRSALSGVPAVLTGAEALPLRSDTFDGITIAFGLRNFEDPVAGLSEMHRVLKPGGHAVILEFLAQERGGWGGPLVRFYLEHVLPKIGALVSGDKAAYSYLSNSSQNFWTPTELRKRLLDLGYEAVRIRPWMGSAVTLTIASKAA